MTVKVRNEVMCGAAAVVICLAALAVLKAGAQQTNETEANPKIAQQEAFTVVGISERTNNAKEATADGVIGKTWARFMTQSLRATIPNKTDESIMVVYTDYASDANGDYTYLLGARVTKAESVPAGMIAKTVPAGRYAVFTSERGLVQQVVVATWKKIWATPKTAPGGNRAYKADFEVYDQRAQNPADTVMEIHVGIR